MDSPDNTRSVIDLNHLEATKALDANQMIFRDSFLQMADTILNKVALEKAEVRSDKQTPHRNYNFCYFINGGRGMGKSTFLRALKHHLTHSECQKEEQRSSRIASLADLDPTVLADSEIFFIHVLSQIHEKIREFSPGHFPHTDYRREQVRNAINTICSMSKGLRLLSAPKNGSSSALTAELFIEESVEQYISSAKLRAKFADLMENLCALANVDAFLITIDDADMNFNKCSEVMETVRKYMLCSRLIFVFAGDLKLYTLVVRGMQLHHFGELSLKYDNERKEHRIELLDNLEEQYILKLFPTENRVNLTSISDLVSSQENSIFVKEDEKKDIITIHDFIHRFIKHIVPSTHLLLLEHYVENMTTRTLFQLLRYWMQYATYPDSSKKNPEEGHTKAAIGLTNGILHIASHALIKHKVDVNAIHGGDFPELIKTVLSHSASAENPLSASRLLPQSGSDSYKLVAFYLSSEIARQTKRHASKLCYLCRVFPCLQIISTTQEKEKKSDMQNLEKEFILRASQSLNSRQWAAICTARLTPDKRSVLTKHFGNGGVRLMKDAQKTIRTLTPIRGNREIELNAFNRIGVLGMLNQLLHPAPAEQDKLKKSDDFAFILAFYYSLSRDAGDNCELYYCSVYNLLFFILDCIDLLSAERDMQRDICEEKLRELMKAQAGIPLATSVFNLTEKDEDDEKDTTYRDYLNLLQNNSEHLDKIAVSIYDWWEKYKGIGSTSYAVRLADCWEIFLNKCTIQTRAVSLSNRKAGDFPSCGTLLVSFMKCFTEAIAATCSQEPDDASQQTPRLDVMLEEFPLWEVLTKPKDKKHGLTELINSVNIGAMLYTGLQRTKKTPDEEATQEESASGKATKRQTRKSSTKKPAAPTAENSEPTQQQENSGKEATRTAPRKKADSGKKP